MSVASIILPAGDAHDFLRDYQEVLLRAMRHKLGDPRMRAGLPETAPVPRDDEID